MGSIGGVKVTLRGGLPGSVAGLHCPIGTSDNGRAQRWGCGPRTAGGLVRAWILMAGLAWTQALAAAEPLPFVDPATGLVSQQLRWSMVVARLGEPPPGRGAEASAADLQIDDPELGLSFQAPAGERPPMTRCCSG